MSSSGSGSSGSSSTGSIESSKRSRKPANIVEENISVLEFKDVKAWVPNYKEQHADGTKAIVTRSILKGVSGRVTSGSLTMLMGASGAGKSTLLDILAFRTSKGVHYSGSITINGVELTLPQFQERCAYVTQDSFFIGDLTIRETLEFQCSMRLSSDVSREERESRVHDTLLSLALLKLADVRVKELNTANRKKLNIAISLLTKPLVLFCDEPTTSLDATTARSVVESLRALAQDRGILVFCTIHQPSVHVFNLFDNALVMALGQMAYEGPVDELVASVAAIGHECPSDMNPAEFIIELLSTKAGDKERNEAVQVVIDDLQEVCASLDRTLAPHHQRVLDEHKDGEGAFSQLGKASHPGHFMLVYHLFMRDCLVTLRNEKAFRTMVAQSIGMGIVLGFLYYMLPLTQAGANDRLGFMFLASSNALFVSIQSSIMVAVVERAVFLKEVAEGSYVSIDYLLGKGLSRIPFQVLYTGLFSVSIYFLVGLQTSFMHWLYFYLFLMLVALTGAAFGLAVSVATGDVATATALTPAIGIPAMLFSGFVVQTDAIVVWLRWIRYLSPIRYSLSGLLLNELTDLKFRCAPTEVLPSGQCPIPTGESLIHTINADENGTGLWIRYLALVLLYIVAIFAAYLTMVIKERKSKQRGASKSESPPTLSSSASAKSAAKSAAAISSAAGSGSGSGSVSA